MSLQLDWCSHKAAKYAAENYHYSGCLPASPTARIGVWECGEFIGAVTYSKGANNNMGSFINLPPTEACELTRVALRGHKTPVTRILSISRVLLTDRFSRLKAVISYADPNQDHVGTIYQADNWIYTGRTEESRRPVIDGESIHARSAYEKYGTSSISKLKARLGADRVGVEMRKGKHRYVYPLDDDVRERAESMSEPYPDEP
jgi:hypothetical protein